jgi:glycerol kinase
LFGHGCTEVGEAKATYGTGTSVMAPVVGLSASEERVPTTLAWVIDESPTYALEGNILSSGATLAWTADLLTDGRVADLITLAESVPDSGGVTLVPAFSGLGAPHWDRDAHALISGMSPATTRAHIARAAVDSISHQICDIVDVIEETAPLQLFRADGGATASQLVVQTQADLLGREVEVSETAEVSALGAAKLAWRSLGRESVWPTRSLGRVYVPIMDSRERRRRRERWAGEISRTRFTP